MEQNNNNFLTDLFLTDLAKKVEQNARKFADLPGDDDDDGLFDSLPCWKEIEQQALLYLNTLNFLAPPCYDDDDDE